MRILVTGAAGFLGSNLCKFLIDNGHEVIGMDNLLSGTTDHLDSLFENENFLFIKHDVTEYIHIQGDLDYILHFASPASPKDYLDFPIETLKVNALGTHKTIGLAKEKGAKYLLASTSEVYGDPLVNPQPESYWGNVNPIGPRGVYDESKRFAEALVMAYYNTNGIDCKIARIFNTYGPNMRSYDGRAIPTFICQALRNEPITVFGDGSQTRSFLYVDDLIEGIYRLMNSSLNEPINLGSQEEMALLDLAKTIIKLTNSQSEIVFKELPVDDPKVRRPDITVARKKINWVPMISLHDGIKKTVNYFKNHKEL